MNNEIIQKSIIDLYYSLDKKVPLDLVANELCSYHLKKARDKEGSRGGVVIGHTRSGNPIYQSHNHEDHKNFNDDDHYDAASHHAKIIRDADDKRDKKTALIHSEHFKEHASKIDKDNKKYKDWHKKDVYGKFDHATKHYDKEMSSRIAGDKVEIKKNPDAESSYNIKVGDSKYRVEKQFDENDRFLGWDLFVHTGEKNSDTHDGYDWSERWSTKKDALSHMKRQHTEGKKK